MPVVTNFEGSVVSSPAVVARPVSVEEVVDVMREPERFPSPVRPSGSNHSTTPVCAADGGTLLDMSGMSEILEIGSDTVTAQAGAHSIDVATALHERGLQFFVNVELGNLSLGSMATAGAKDSSFPGEYGWPAAYVTGVKLVTATGDVLTVSAESDPELMQAVRSSHGLLGAVVEVTMRVRRLEAMAVRHETFKLDDFCARLTELLARDESMMLYIFPHLGRVTVEWRRYPGTTAQPRAWDRTVWRLRNLAWKTLSPGFATAVTKVTRPNRLRYSLIDVFNHSVHLSMDYLIRGTSTNPTDQIVRYPERPGRVTITFSIWCFPEADFAAVLRDYTTFAREYRERTGWRVNHAHVGFKIAADTSALLSPSFEGPVLTIDPICTGDEGWQDYYEAFNEFASARGGAPLLNQTPGLTADHARRAFGARLSQLDAVRAKLDPGDRLLSPYFAGLLA